MFICGVKTVKNKKDVVKKLQEENEHLKKSYDELCKTYLQLKEDIKTLSDSISFYKKEIRKIETEMIKVCDNNVQLKKKIIQQNNEIEELKKVNIEIIIDNENLITINSELSYKVDSLKDILTKEYKDSSYLNYNLNLIELINTSII